MPSPSKHSALEKAGYKLAPTCSNCVHFTKTTSSEWGRCSAIYYEHEKHLGSMQAGVIASGTCERFGLDETRLRIVAGDDYFSRYAPKG